jgi:hypothetical protein
MQKKIISPIKKEIDEFDSEKDIDEFSVINEISNESFSNSSIEQNNSIIISISKLLKLVLEENKKINDYNQKIISQSKMIFSSYSIPKISIYDYLIRIKNYCLIETSTLICSLIYIDRIFENWGIILTYYNIHRILFAAILSSIKYNEDIFYDNKYYAEVFGVKSKELKLIEYSFMRLLNFNLFILEEQYSKYENYIENSV